MEAKNETLEEPALPAKRKPNIDCVDERKKKKSENPDINPSVVEEKLNKDEISEKDDEDEDDVEDEDADDDDDEEEEDDQSEHSNGKSVVDSKGKGIMKEDKGKGKSKAEDGSDDDSSESGAQSDDDSDFSDDPLAEVDLDNILPSRTRRRVAQPGANLVNDIDDNDDSDDSDA